MDDYTEYVAIHGYYKNYSVLALKALYHFLHNTRLFNAEVSLSPEQRQTAINQVSRSRLRRRLYLRKWHRDYYRAHREEMLAKITRRRNEHREEYLEKQRQYHKEYRERNKNAIRAKKREERLRYIEKYRERGKKWREANRDKMREYQRRWKEKKKREKALLQGSDK